ncbi:Cytochrome P450 9e2 [Eumeta japonica]|uniref:unspecific monooxygenase n=1 Tax=Eumeta variegata TaxID=151549 RepID=A0A4C1UKC4_EUMVA|nr:Cytochrome P450 9e2 [Eumeta japonica]
MYLYIWLGVLLAVLWLYFRKTYSYFKHRGVNYLPPVPVLGNMARTILKMEHMVEGLNRLYFSFPDDRFVGNYEFLAPTMMIRDPELIRLIGIKDFDSFTDHRRFSNEKDPFFAKSLFGLRGDAWRDMRATLSPAFTGSKLRGMVPLIQDCSQNLVRYLDNEMKKDGYLDVDTKDLFTRYTNDVIATCAFGLRVDSITEKDNQFYNMGYDLTNLKFRQIVKMFLVLSFPSLSTLKHENIKDEKDAGFSTVEESTIGKRTIKRVWDDEHLVAQALLFFFAGFDTVSTAMMFLLYELAVNPDIQAKLRQEIDDYFNEHHGKIDYDKINKMQYMDMVLSETLRKWPPAPNTDRYCQKRYNLGKPHEKATKDVYLEEGSVVVIPVWPIHYDPKYYPDPHRFDPERFSDENKHNINPFTYLPFGVGPRNCIGSRFAIIEVKAMVFDLLRHFELSPAPKTRVPAKLDPSQFAMRFLGGHWIRIKPRDVKA